MQRTQTKRLMNIAMAFTIVMVVGSLVQVRAARPSANATSNILNVVGAGQASAPTFDPPPPPPPPRGGRDSINKARMDSIIRAEHIQDSLNRAHLDSLLKANHQRDSINPPPPPRQRDSLSHARQDSLNQIGHQRDSLNRARMDSLNQIAHVRDSLNRARMDSLMQGRRDSLPPRDSIPPNPPRRDSLIKIRRDSLHGREIHFKNLIDSLIRCKLDSLHMRDSIAHAGSDTASFTKQGSGNEGLLALQSAPLASPSQIGLAQNYPNPFGGSSSSTLINFTLPSDQGVSLTVYNAAGQYVSTLVRGQLTAGAHSTTFNGANLPAGIYFYKLVTEQGTLTNRMIKIH